MTTTREEYRAESSILFHGKRKRNGKNGNGNRNGNLQKNKMKAKFWVETETKQYFPLEHTRKPDFIST
jgi:hypothetical protein